MAAADVVSVVAVASVADSAAVVVVAGFDFVAAVRRIIFLLPSEKGVNVCINLSYYSYGMPILVCGMPLD